MRNRNSNKYNNNGMNVERNQNMREKIVNKDIRNSLRAKEISNIKNIDKNLVKKEFNRNN